MAVQIGHLSPVLEKKRRSFFQKPFRNMAHFYCISVLGHFPRQAERVGAILWTIHSIVDGTFLLPIKQQRSESGSAGDCGQGQRAGQCMGRTGGVRRREGEQRCWLLL